MVWSKSLILTKEPSNMSDFTPADIPTLTDAQFQSLYEQLGIQFIGEQAILQFNEESKVVLDKSALLNPSIEDLKKLRDQINSLLGDQIELFDSTDSKYEINFAGNRTREMGRVFSHFDIECSGFRCEKVNYYKYLKLEANSNVSNDGWNRVIQYVFCVIATVGLLVVITVVSGGTLTVAAFALLTIAISSGCALVVNGTDRNNAYLKTYEGT
jgi:hypothetical protein